MEIQKMTKQGLIKVSSNVVIFCNIIETTAGVTEIMASVQRGGQHAGTITAYSSGRVVLYYEADSELSKEEKKKIFSAFIDDAEKIFTPKET